MFWLCLISRIQKGRRTSRPVPRPSRHPCTRRPVSSGAPGRHGGRMRDGHTPRRAGHTPRRRSPFPSVSSSSSSFLSCGFPRLFRLLSGPGFGSRTRVSEPPARLFDQVQVSENHVQPEVSFRRRVRGFGPIRPASISVASARPRPAPAEFKPSSDDGVSRRPFFRATTRFRPPVPFVCCSFRSWFVSQVRLSFSSVQFVFVSPGLSFCSVYPSCSASARSSVSCSIPFASFRLSRSFSPVRFRLVLSSIFVFAC